MAKFKIGDMVRCEWDNDLDLLIKKDDIYIVKDVFELTNPDDWTESEWLYLRGVTEDGKEIAIRAIRFSLVR